jgi:hypothetical protein
LYSTGSRGTTTLTAGLATTFAASRFTARFTGRALRPAPRVERVRVARIFPLSPADPASASQELRLPSCLPWALSFRIAPRPLRDPLVTGAEPEVPFLLRLPHPTSCRERWAEDLDYFLRCTIMRSVRLLPRVFLPSVGKAHGV